MTDDPMTGAVQVPPVDTGNTLLGGVPAQLTVSEQMAPSGKVAALTIRTPCTTLTVFLAREELANWAATMQRTADQMGGLVVIGAGLGTFAAPGQVAP